MPRPRAFRPASAPPRCGAPSWGRGGWPPPARSAVRGAAPAARPAAPPGGGAAPRVLAAMVPFNVVWRADGHLHQGTSGVLHLEAGPRALPLLDALNRAGLPTRDEIDMRAVLWGKLLLNLNNPINALAGVPLRDE